MERIGRSLDDLARIVCTHAHPDHIGGVRELAGEREVEVLMHPADLDGLSVTLRDAVANRNRGQLIAYFTRHPGEATPIEDGQVLPILGGLRVVHCPGHTPGQRLPLRERHRLLFVGDALQVIRGKVTFASRVFSEDLPLARASVARTRRAGRRDDRLQPLPAAGATGRTRCCGRWRIEQRAWPTTRQSPSHGTVAGRKVGVGGEDPSPRSTPTPAAPPEIWRLPPRGRAAVGPQPDPR